MGIINRMFGYPDGDATGRDRSLFRKVGSKAADAFLGRHDANTAMDILEGWTTQVYRQCGEWHPDIGRASLLMSVFMAMTAKYEGALELATSAQAVLSKLGPNDYDHRAAVYLTKKLEQVVEGTWDKAEGPFIDAGTPAGDFLYDLRP